MANDYMAAAVEVPSVTAEELAWFREVLEKIESIDVWIDTPAKEADAMAILVCTLPGYVEEEAAFDWGWTAHFPTESGYSIVFESDEYANIDALASLLQSFLVRFRPKGHLTMEWAYTCSKGRPGGFGGGAAFITAEEISVHDTSAWLEDMLVEHTEEKGQWISQPAANKLMS